MDLMTGLTALGEATKIAKALRDIERDLDSSTYKAQMAELYSNLGDAKIALTDAREELRARDREIAALKAQIATLKSGESCPICQSGRLKVTASNAHPQFGVFGHQERTLTCDNSSCGHTELRKYVPPEGR
ncbi:MAG: hypothetical protein KIT02_00815 [Devosia sp.]|uniref:hypothetical protein n=1 Tax=Devosia sp. TaxID=1871048 RepID=UPI0024CDF8AA|nr:hypothetical protein [Devosia sp.]UYN99817.1 MAG: hypothetical protein KIT02_00815 [Devosia sp.]